MQDHDLLKTSCKDASVYLRRTIIGRRRGRVSRKAVPVMIAGLAISATGGLGLAVAAGAYTGSTIGECISGQACGQNDTIVVATNVSLSSSLSLVSLPAAPTLTATVSEDPNDDDGPVPGGTVQFLDSATGTIGSAPVVNVLGR